VPFIVLHFHLLIPPRLLPLHVLVSLGLQPFNLFISLRHALFHPPPTFSLLFKLLLKKP
jgi:hypothetical protein